MSKDKVYKPQIHKLFTEWVSLLWQNLGTVIILSAIGFFASAPIVTGGAIFIGVFNITKLLVRKELVLREDFTSAVKEKWKTATALFLVNLLILFVIGYALYFYWINPEIKMFFWVGIWFFIVFFMGLIYMYPLLADQDIGLKKIFSRSFKMAMVDPGFSFVMALVSILWIVLCFILIPMLATLAIGGFALWSTLAYREMSLKVDSILALKEAKEEDDEDEEEESDDLTP